MAIGMGSVPFDVGQPSPGGIFPSLPPSVGIPIGERKGWRVLGIHYTCIPNSLYPWDPAVIRGIWEFEPTWVPMWVVHEAINDGMDSPISFGNHAIGRVVDDPRMGTDYFTLGGFSVSMPSMPCQGISFRRPSHLELLIPWWDRYPALPFGPYYPFDWSVVRFLKEVHMEPDPAKLHELLVEQPTLRWERDKKRRDDEKAYIAKDLYSYTNRKLNEMSDVERSEYHAADEQDLSPDKKSFVHVRENP